MPDNSKWKVKTKRYVAFLDILGFKDFVLRHSIDEVYERLQILNALRPEEGEQEDDPDVEKYLKFTIFSDSIFIFTKDDSFPNLRRFLSYVKKVMRLALRKEIPLKGAIAYGDIVVDDEVNLFCGQPIIDAYLLEEDLQYMGVVCHHTFEDAYFNLSDTQFKRLSNWLKEVKTPFKYGIRTHLNLDYRISGLVTFNLKEQIETQRFYSSGDARKYVDNTLDVLGMFDRPVESEDK